MTYTNFQSSSNFGLILLDYSEKVVNLCIQKSLDTHALYCFLDFKF